MTGEGVSPEQKAEIIKDVTELLERTLDKSPATTFVVIGEIELENCGVGGQPVEQWCTRNS